MPPRKSQRTRQREEQAESSLAANPTPNDEEEDLAGDLTADLGFDSELEEGFSGESDYYQPSDDEVDEDDMELDQGFQDMELDEEDIEAYDEDEEERNEREFEKLMEAATAKNYSDANENLRTLWDVGEGDLEDFQDNLAETAGIGRSRRRKGKRRQKEYPLTPEIKALLGDANEHYIKQEYAEAIELYQEIVRQDSKVHSAWVNLALIQEELGNREKALLLKMVAAHLKPKEIDTWKSLASASLELGVRHQAIYCLRKVLSANPKDVDALWDRSFLLKEDGKPDAAIGGFTELLEIQPHHVKVIDELAKLYRSKDDLGKAIELYEAAMDYHFENDNLDEVDENNENLFRYTEINMLTELYIMVNEYEKALMCIKYGVLYLQRRIDEIDWSQGLEPGDEDDEFDPVAADPATEYYDDFPLELRARMAVCRIHLDNFDVAKKHVAYLENRSVEDYGDLYQEVAAAYMDKGKYDLALALLQKIVDEEEAIDVDVLIRCGDCFREVGDLEMSIQYYNAVLNEQTNNLDVMMALAQVYEEMGEEEKAFDLVTHVMRRNRENRRLQELQENNSVSAMSPAHEVPGMGSLFDEALIAQEHRSRQTQIRAAQKLRERQREEERTEWTKRSFASLKELKKRIEASQGQDTIASTLYLEEARTMWEEFTSVKALYPADKSKKFIGFRLKKAGASKYETEVDIEGELHRMATRLSKAIKNRDFPEDSEEAERIRELQEEQKELEEKYRQIASASGFRGISFDDWLDTFITYCFILTNSGHPEVAYQVLTRIGEANVFYHDPKRKLGLKLTIIACALLCEDHSTVYDITRSITTLFQFQDDGYKLYTALLSNGSSNIMWYAPSMTLKYLSRQVKIVDQLVLRANKHEANGETAAAEEQEEATVDGLEDTALQKYLDSNDDISSLQISRHLPREKYPKKPIISLLLLLGNTFQMTKNQTAAIVYYSRAFALCPKESLISLLLGSAYLNRSVQRITDNRHLQIAQGFTFLYKYYERRKDMQYAQEAEYNLGRAFHSLNLTHLAVPYYERALALPSRKQVLEVGEELAMRGHTMEDLLETVYDWEIPHPWHLVEDDPTDLRSEAAYNLHLIYILSGTPGLAQMLMIKYCSV